MPETYEAEFAEIRRLLTRGLMSLIKYQKY